MKLFLSFSKITKVKKTNKKHIHNTHKQTQKYMTKKKLMKMFMIMSKDDNIFQYHRFSCQLPDHNQVDMYPRS